jgi:hypothetical protein
MFCHFTVTSNIDDYSLMEKTINGLTLIENLNMRAHAKLQNLLHGFLKLCQPLLPSARETLPLSIVDGSSNYLARLETTALLKAIYQLA